MTAHKSPAPSSSTLSAPSNQPTQLHPRVGVGVFLIHAPTRTFLFGQRQGSLGHDTWALPGGHLDFGESFEMCAAREVEEETGIVLDDDRVEFWTATNSVMEDGTRGRSHYVTVFMMAKVGEERPVAERREPDKCLGWEWVKWEDLERWAVAEIEGRAGGGSGKEQRRLFQPMRDLLVQRKGLVPDGL